MSTPGMQCYTNGYVNRFGELSTCRDCVRDHLGELAKGKEHEMEGKSRA